jgi:radical SAM superfamily enzyme YgiQ (UPF0313 family)
MGGFLYKHFPEYLFSGNPTFENPPFDAAPYRVLIVRLSPFRDVDRSIPHLFLYQEVRRARPDAYVDLAFFPGAHQREVLEGAGLPYLIGTQSRQPVQAFDLVLISNAYTLELINLPYLLLHSGMPLYASARGPEWPAMILGGSNALASQAIVSEGGDSLVDGIFFGEGEGFVERLVAQISQARDLPKRMVLQHVASEIDGLWVSGAFTPTRKAVCTPDASTLATEYPLLNSAEAHTASLQINYGCPAFCSFCFEGYERKPYREVPLADLLETARQIKRLQGVEQVNLYSFNFNTYSQILPLLLELHRLFYRVNFMSQRIDILHQAGYLLEAEVLAGKRSFTLGIEGISERQRAFLHKSLDRETILGLLRRILSQRIREIKLFYILTGHEDEQDLEDFRAFVRQLKALRREHKSGVRVIFSFGLLVRMPFTPLRYDALLLEEGAWRQRIGTCKSACETNGFEFRMAFDWPTYCVTQVLAMGGYWLLEPLISLARQGHSFDEALPEGYWDQFQAQLARSGRLSAAFVGEKGLDWSFALDFCQTDISETFLYRQYQEAVAGKDGGYCLGGADDRGRCLGCGACLDESQRRQITQHQIDLPDKTPYLAQVDEMVTRKRRLKPLYYLLDVSGVPVGVQPALLNAFVMRALLAHYPDLSDNLLAVRESLFTVLPPSQGRKGAKRGRYMAMPGESIFALVAWDAGALQRSLVEPIAGAPPPVHVVGPAAGFQPGLFTRIHLDLTLDSALFPQARQQLEEMLRESYVPYSLRREDQGYRFEVPQKGMRKKVLLGGHFQVDVQAFRAALDVGPRFDLLAFLERFGPPYHAAYADLCAARIEWE